VFILKKNLPAGGGQAAAPVRFSTAGRRTSPSPPWSPGSCWPAARTWPRRRH